MTDEILNKLLHEAASHHALGANCYAVDEKDCAVAQLCRSRIEQDPEYPKDIIEYLPYLTFHNR